MVRFLEAAKGLFAGMIAGLACVMLGLIALAAVPDTAPQVSIEPVARFDLALASPPEVNADLPLYHPIRDGLEQAGLYAVISHSALPVLARRALPAERAIDSRAARGMAGVYGDGPRLDLPKPGPDQPYRSDVVSKSSIMPRPGSIGGALLTASAELSAGPGTVSLIRGGGPTGPEHFLQGGYFAERENAAGLSEKLVAAGLSVLMEQMENRAGKTRWRVLVGPYRQKEYALRARRAAADLLTEAFYIVIDN